jgi:hypothetical protein
VSKGTSSAAGDPVELTAGPGQGLLLAGLKQDGTLYTRSGRGNHFGKFVQQGDAGSWSTARVAVDSRGRPELLAITKHGDLFFRGETESGWGNFVLDGTAGAWSPAAAPTIAAEPSGELTIGAVRRNGTLLTSSTRGGNSSDFVPHGDRRSWSTSVRSH